MREITTHQEIIYKGKILTLKKHQIKMENGVEAIREIVEHNGAVAVFVIQNHKMLFVSQYRKAYEEYVLEIPAGKLEPGEDPGSCAARELEEETGLKASKMTLVQILYPSPGFCTEKIYLYHATGLTEGQQNMDEDEHVEVHWIDTETVKEMIKKGQFHDAKTIAAVLHWIAGIIPSDQ